MEKENMQYPQTLEGSESLLYTVWNIVSLRVHLVPNNRKYRVF